jgi:hypothetical protein
MQTNAEAKKSLKKCLTSDRAYDKLIELSQTRQIKQKVP